MEDELKGLVPVTKNNIKTAALTLARAFQDYPVSIFFEPDEEKRKKQTPRIYRLVLQSAIATGEVYATSPEMEGVAVWTLSDNLQPEGKHGFSMGWLWVSLFSDKEADKRREAFFEYSQAVRARVVPGRYWYLQMLGVDPAYQGKGFSSRLLKPMLERADREGLLCCLETQLEKNVPLYQHFGFRVVEEGLIPDSNVYSWAMVRKNA